MTSPTIAFLARSQADLPLLEPALLRDPEAGLGSMAMRRGLAVMLNSVWKASCRMLASVFSMKDSTAVPNSGTLKQRGGGHG